MSNIIKLQAPFERLRASTISPDVALRKAIILQAVIDASSKAKDAKAIKAKTEAQRWIFDCCYYFQKLCFEADISHQKIVDLLRK